MNLVEVAAMLSIFWFFPYALICSFIFVFYVRKHNKKQPWTYYNSGTFAVINIVYAVTGFGRDSDYEKIFTSISLSTALVAYCIINYIYKECRGSGKIEKEIDWECPDCGKINSGELLKCSNCGWEK